MDHDASSRRLHGESDLLTQLVIADARYRLYAQACRCALDAAVAKTWRRAERDAERAVSRLRAQTGSVSAGEAPAALACLIDAMDLALQNGDRPAAQLVAQECVRIAEVYVAAQRASGLRRAQPAQRPYGSQRGFDDETLAQPA